METTQLLKKIVRRKLADKQIIQKCSSNFFIEIYASNFLYIIKKYFKSDHSQIFLLTTLAGLISVLFR